MASRKISHHLVLCFYLFIYFFDDDDAITVRQIVLLILLKDPVKTIQEVSGGVMKARHLIG